MAKISVFDPSQYVIDYVILVDLLNDVRPGLDERPEAWTRATIALVQPGLEILTAGLRVACRKHQNARRRALNILSELVAGEVPVGRLHSQHLRALVAGYRLATRTSVGAAATPLFLSRLLEAL